MPRRIRWAGHVADVGDMRIPAGKISICKCWPTGSIILKHIFKTQGVCQPDQDKVT
jgi:hypothetical protein